MNIKSDEQEEYLASHGHREPGLMETGTNAVKEWAWELETNASGLVMLNRNVPRYRGQDIKMVVIKRLKVSGKEGLSISLA